MKEKYPLLLIHRLADQAIAAALPVEHI